MTVATALLLPPDIAGEYVRRLERQTLQDGRATAGVAGQNIKLNQQLVDTPESLAISQEIGHYLQRARDLMEPLCIRSSLPFMFNCYRSGMEYRAHTDNAIMYHRGVEFRTDLSATVFLSPPDSYAGGELMIGVDQVPVRVKLPAGGIVIYPANTLHQVLPVTSGVRWGAVTWFQSRVRSIEQRQVLYTLARGMQGLGPVQDHPLGSPERIAFDAMIRARDDLLRMWSQ